MKTRMVTPLSQSPSLLMAPLQFASLLFAPLLFAPLTLHAQIQNPYTGTRHGGMTAPASTTTPPPLATTAKQPATTSAPPASAAMPAATQPVSLLQQPPKQAEIQAHANSLAIQADNASLTQTLQRIADKTGMHLEGVTGDQRVFGDFGPGNPRDVLNTLLTGTGYNVLMIGALDNGAPRQLILTQKKADATPNAAPAQAAPSSSFDDDPPPDNSAQDDQPAPQQNGPPPGRGGDPNRGARTPQQMLEQMQQMRNQAEQQQPQQQ